MNNYDYPEGSDTPNAPWNQIDPIECEECGSDNTRLTDFGYKCIECGYINEYEPDWDSMKGGHDDY